MNESLSTYTKTMALSVLQSVASANHESHRQDCPECASVSITISKLESRVDHFKQKYLQALGDLMHFVSTHRIQPDGHIHSTHLQPNGSPIVNSQVTDVHPNGSVTVSQSTNQHSRPDFNSHHSHGSFRPRPSRRPYPRPDLHSEMKPIENSQVTDMHPNGSITVSQSTNHHPSRPEMNSHESNRPFRPRPSRRPRPRPDSYPHSEMRPIINSQSTDVHPNGTVTSSQSTNHSDRPSMNSYEQLNAPFKPNSSRGPQHTGRRPIVNTQVTNDHPDGNRPIVNSQVTEF